MVDIHHTQHIYAGADRICTKIGKGGLNHLTNLTPDSLLFNARRLQKRQLEEMPGRRIEPAPASCNRKIDGTTGNDLNCCQVEKKSVHAEVYFEYTAFHNTMTQLLTDNGIENVRYFYHPDHLGSASWITTLSGQPIEHLQYLPYGEARVDQRAGIYHERYTFTGKEKDSETGYYYFGARYYNPDLSLWLSVDLMSDKYPNLSPYNYCAWNPMKIVDPNGNDTIDITFNTDTKKWEISKPIIAEGNDVFNVTGADGNVTAFTFSEGDYGERIDCLNIDVNSDYALGVYHVSGTDKGGTGFYVTPGGEASKKTSSKKRIPEGTYPITTPTGDEEWRQPGVGGDVIGRGVRFHYGNGNPRAWTEGCFVLFTDYTLSGTGIRITKNNSISASESFDKHLGASGFYNYTIKRSNGTTRSRQGATFPQKINKMLVLK